MLLKDTSTENDLQYSAVDIAKGNHSKRHVSDVFMSRDCRGVQDCFYYPVFKNLSFVSPLRSIIKH